MHLEPALGDFVDTDIEIAVAGAMRFRRSLSVDGGEEPGNHRASTHFGPRCDEYRILFEQVADRHPVIDSIGELRKQRENLTPRLEKLLMRGSVHWREVTHSRRTDRTRGVLMHPGKNALETN